MKFPPPPHPASQICFKNVGDWEFAGKINNSSEAQIRMSVLSVPFITSRSLTKRLSKNKVNKHTGEGI